MWLLPPVSFSSPDLCVNESKRSIKVSGQRKNNPTCVRFRVEHYDSFDRGEKALT